jgi:hypothetical protein
MVTTTLRRIETAPHASCLELVVHENSNIAQFKGTLTGRASVSLQEVKLDLSDFFRQSKRNKKLRKLFKALGDLPHVKTLRFHYAVLQRLPVHLLTIALHQAAGRLETLELANVSLEGTEEEFEDFLNLLQHHSSLQIFSFSSSGCCSSCNINNIMAALSTTPHLEKVVIYSEGRSPWGRMTGDAVGTLCRSTTVKDLQHLVLYDSSSRLGMGNFFTDEHTVAMAQALSINSNDNPQNSTRLEEVMISTWPLGKAGIKALCQMIRVNTSLRKLTVVIYELQDNSAADQNNNKECGIVDLAKALEFNSTLTVLELHGRSEIGKWIEEAFLEMMKTNYALRTLKLFNDDSFLKLEIDFYLKLNRAGRDKLLQNANSTRNQWMEAIVTVRDDLSCLFYFLSVNPLLCQVDEE